MTTRWARIARGFSAANFAIFVAVSFHITAAGAAPSGIALAFSLSFSTLVCVGLSVIYWPSMASGSLARQFLSEHEALKA